MKKTLLIAVISIAFNLAGFGQIIFNQFQIRVTDMPGASNRAVVQAKAVGSVLPVVSSCDPDGSGQILDNVIGGMKFTVYWPATSGVTNIAIGLNNAPENCDDPENAPPGSNPAAGQYSLAFANTAQNANGYYGRNLFMNQLPIPSPDNWVLNEWITICTLNVIPTSVGCQNCDMFSIYVEGTNPDLENLLGDVGHTFAFDEEGSGFAPEYDLAPMNAPLPLDLVKFTAEKSENNALVEWTTVNEFNTSHFTVQRSYDKNLWFNIGEAKAAGFSTEVKSYNYTDFQVYNGRDARLQVYYRLNMVDLDGKQRYSPIQSIVWGSGVSTSRDFVIFPNPASEGVHVEWDANEVDQPTAIELYDIAGKMIMSVPVSDQTNQQYIDFKPSQIQSGLYLMRIMHNDEAIEHKQIVVGRAN